MLTITNKLCDALETYQPPDPDFNRGVLLHHHIHQLLGGEWFAEIHNLDLESYELFWLIIEQMMEEGTLESHLIRHFGKPVANRIGVIKLSTFNTYQVRKGKEQGRTVTTRGEVNALVRWIQQNENATLDQANYFEAEERGNTEMAIYTRTAEAPMPCQENNRSACESCELKCTASLAPRWHYIFDKDFGKTVLATGYYSQKKQQFYPSSCSRIRAKLGQVLDHQLRS